MPYQEVRSKFEVFISSFRFHDRRGICQSRELQIIKAWFGLANPNCNARLFMLNFYLTLLIFFVKEASEEGESGVRDTGGSDVCRTDFNTEFKKNITQNAKPRTPADC